MKVCRICTSVVGDEETCPICGASTSVPVKNVASAPVEADLPSFDDEGACAVCGIPLEGDVCDMCGSPRMETGTRDLTFRCPFCSEPIDPNATSCPHCGVGYVDREKEKDIDYKCPVCDEVVSLMDDKCSSCGTAIWLDFEAEKKAISSFKCPTCDEVVSPDMKTCPNCGSGIWVGDEDLKESAEKAIEEASANMQTVSADLGRAEVVLVSAKEAYESGDFLSANRAANLSAEIAKSTRLQTKIFQDAVRRAQNMITSVKKKGGDTSDAIDLLRRAVRVKQTGNLRGAVRLAIKSRIRAEEAVPTPRLSDIDLD